MLLSRWLLILLFGLIDLQYCIYNRRNLIKVYTHDAATRVIRRLMENMKAVKLDLELARQEELTGAKAGK